MKPLFLVIIIFNSACSVTQGNSEDMKSQSKTGNTPINIRYVVSTPPDSISDFLKVYLQSNGYKVVGLEESRELWFGEMQSKNGKINALASTTSSVEELKEKMFGLYDVACRLLILRIFKNPKIEEKFIVDSIVWRTYALPPKDSTEYMTYYPKYSDSSNIYSSLKEFANVVISSGLINK